MSCFGDSTGPGEMRPGRLSFLPRFNPGSHLVDFDQVRVVLTRPGTTTVVLDTTVAFPATADSIVLTLTVPIEGASEALNMVMDLIDLPSGSTVFRVGPTQVTAAVALGAPQALPPFLYVGPGANATGIRFVSTSGSAFFGDTASFTAEAVDAQNVVIPGTPIIWSVSDTTRATLVADSLGRVVARTTRGPVNVTASLLRTSATQNPPSVTTALAIQPRPSAIQVQSGNSQTGTAGAALAQQITARVLAADQLGVQGAIVTFAVTAGGGSLSQLADTTDANGDVAVTWTLGNVAGAAQAVSATVSGVPAATVAFCATATPAAAAALEFNGQPSDANENAVITPAIMVRARDGFGNVNTSFTGSVTLAILANPGGGTLAGTLTRAAVAGVATFNDITINNAGAGYTLLASSGTLTPDTSVAFSIAATNPVALAFDVQPSNTVAGVAITPAIQVSARNGANAVITGFTGPVTLSIDSGAAGATLGGTLTVNAVAGVATFSNVTLDFTGTYRLRASAAGPVTQPSANFVIGSGPAAILTFSTQPPSSTTFDTPFITVATARDAQGNVASGYSGAVTLGIGSNPSGGALYGTTTVNAVAGVATFSGIEVDNIGAGYTLTANAAGLAGAGSAPMNVVAPANGNAWINPAGGNWSTAANWSKGTVPNATDTVFIRRTGTYTVNLDVSATVNRLIVGGRAGAQTLLVNGGTLTSGGTGVVVNTAGKLALNTGGVLTGSGDFQVFGAFDWVSGDLSAAGGAGFLRIEPGATATISNPGTRSIQNYDLRIAGVANWTGTHTMQSGSAATITVLSGGTLTVTGDPQLSYNLGGAVPAIVVQAGGTLTHNSATFGDLTIGGALDNDGTVIVTAGRLVGLNGGTWTGNADVQSGAGLLFQGGTFQLNGGTVGGAGVARVDGATVNASAGWNVTGITVVAGGTLNANGASMSTTALQIVGGVLGGNAGGLLGVSGSMSWSAGNLSGNGATVRVLGGAALSISGTTTRNLQNMILELAGSGTWTGTHTMQAGSSGTLRVLSGATLDLQGDVSLSYNLGGAAPLVHVQGTLLRSTSAGLTTLGGEFDNDGQTTISAGTLRLPGGSGASADGGFTVNGGATLDFSGGTHTLGATSTVTGAGTVTVTGGTVSANGNWSHGGTTQITGGTLNYSAAGGSTTNLAISGGTLGGTSPGVLNVGGALSWTGGSLSGGGGIVRVGAAGTLAISGTATRNLQNYTVELAGSGTWTGTHTVQAGSSGTLRVLAGGALDIQTDASVSYNLGGAAPRIHNQGTITKSAGANFTSGAAFDNDGSVSVTAGALLLAGGGTSTGSHTLGGGGVIEYTGGTHTLGAASTMSGTTTVRVSGSASVNANGSWSFGGTTHVAGGALTYSAAGGSTSSLLVTAGTLGGAAGGLLTVGGSMTWSGGSLSGAGGTVRVANTGTLTISGTATRNLQNYTLELAGTGTWTGTHTVQAGSSGTMRVLAGGSFDIQGDPAVSYVLGGAVPVFENQGTLTRSTSTGAASFGSVFNSSGAIALNSGSLVVLNGGTQSGTAALAGSTILSLNGGTTTMMPGWVVSGLGTLSLAGGTLSGLATNDTAKVSNLLLTGGALNPGAGGVVQVTTSGVWGGNASLGGLGGTLYVPAGTSLQLVGTPTRNFQNATIDNRGTLQWQINFTLQTGSGAVIRNAAGGTFQVNAGGTITQNLGGAAASLDNQGTMLVSAGAGQTFTLGQQFDNSGSITVGTGTLALNSGGTQSGAVSVSTGAFVDFNGGTHTLNNGANYSSTGSVRLNGATITGASPADTARFVNLQLNTGSLSQSGGVVVSGLLDWAGGATLFGTGTTRVLAGGSLTLTGTATRNLQNGTLENRGSGTWSGLFTLQTGSAATFRVTSTGSLSLTSNATFTQNLGGGASFFVNEGAFSVNVPGTSLWNVSIIDTVGTGFTVSGGTFQVQAGTRLGGSKTITSPGLMVLAGGTLTLRPGATLGGTGTFRQTGGTLTPDSASAASQASIQTYDFQGGTIDHEGLLQIITAMTWSGGNIQSNIAGLGGTTRLAGAATLDIAGTATRNFTGSHTLDLLGATTFSGNAQIQTGSGSQFLNSNVFNWTGDGFMTFNLGGTATAFVNQAAGTLRRSVSGNIAHLGIPVGNSGTIQVQTGTLRFASGSVSPLAGTWTASAGTLIDLNAGTFAGTGTTSVTGDVSVSGGSFDPGNKWVQTGSFSTTGSGALVMNAATDSMLITGNITFGGGTSTLTSGAIRLSGDFTQTGGANVFNASGSHRVILDGNVQQNISFAAPTTNDFNVLNVQATNVRDIVLQTDVRADTVLMFGGAQPATLRGAGTTQRLRAAARAEVNVPAGTAPILKPPVLEVGGTIGTAGAAAGTIAAGRGHDADTTVFIGGTQSIPVGVGFDYNSIRVGGSGTASFAGNTTLPNDLVVSSGTLSLVGRAIGVTGNFRTHGTGLLQMTGATDSLKVTGNVDFSGGATSGTLTNGVITVAGNFSQGGTAGGSSTAYTPTSSLATTVHRLVMNGTAAQSISFGNPTASRFDVLRILANNRTVTFLTDGETVDSLHLTAGASAYSMQGPTARVRVGGLLQMDTQTGSPSINSLRLLELSQAPSFQSTSATLAADTIAYINSAVATLPTGSNITYNSIRLNTNANVTMANDTISGNLEVASGTAVFSGATTFQIGGNLSTTGGGAFSQTNAGSRVTVLGDASFAGGISAAINNGVLEVRGDFSQSGNAQAFQASGAHTTNLAGGVGANRQVITFANPGTGANSRFGRVQLGGVSGGVSQPVALQLMSNVQAASWSDTSTIATMDTIIGNTQLQVLTTDTLQSSDLVFSGARLILGSATTGGNVIHSGSNIEFRNMIATQTFMTIHRSTGPGVPLSGFVFNTTPSGGGLYLNVNMPVAGSSTISLSGSSPANGCALTSKTGVGTITLTWNGNTC